MEKNYIFSNDFFNDQRKRVFTKKSYEIFLMAM